LIAVVEGAGFVDVELAPDRWDTFSDAPSASSAAAFGTEGVALRAVKPCTPGMAVSSRTDRCGRMP
jgi:hypothetical protein